MDYKTNGIARGDILHKRYLTKLEGQVKISPHIKIRKTS
jgi:hypothetical protein